MGRVSSIDAALNLLREQIAQNDVALVENINRRLELVAEIKQRKAELGVAFVDPEREFWLFEHLRGANKGRLSDDGLRELLDTLLDLTKRELAES
jgi:chorismate mutase